MERALTEMTISGVPNTTAYLRQVIADEAFRRAEVHTGFLAEHGDRILAALAASGGAARPGEREPRQDDR
jgi:acetyl/propionyl-CoA carboxylase alpha subunit